MVRKSERNKSAASEKPDKSSSSRKSGRSSRRRKKSTSESEPEPDVVKDTSEQIPQPEVIVGFQALTYLNNCPLSRQHLTPSETLYCSLLDSRLPLFLNLLNRLSLWSQNGPGVALVASQFLKPLKIPNQSNQLLSKRSGKKMKNFGEKHL
ncbi:unnamed protein product, partial [Nesidiocoris tenuis]